jgi:FtsH-binding integral membrane protein
MQIAIAATLLLAAVTSGLGVSRQIHGYRTFHTWPFLIAAIFSTVMMLWFAFSAGWVYNHN